MEQNTQTVEGKSGAVPPPYTTGPPPVAAVPPPVIIAQPNMIPTMMGNAMGPKPTPTTCRSCNQQIVSKVELKTSTKTHLFAVLLCCVFFPCACVPYCIDSCHNADHYCPNCNAYLGSYTN